MNRMSVYDGRSKDLPTVPQPDCLLDPIYCQQVQWQYLDWLVSEALWPTLWLDQKIPSQRSKSRYVLCFCHHGRRKWWRARAIARWDCLPCWLYHRPQEPLALLYSTLERVSDSALDQPCPRSRIWLCHLPCWVFVSKTQLVITSSIVSHDHAIRHGKERKKERTRERGKRAKNGKGKERMLASPPIVLSWNSWNWFLTNRSTRLDFPTADSPIQMNQKSTTRRLTWAKMQCCHDPCIILDQYWRYLKGPICIETFSLQPV